MLGWVIKIKGGKYLSDWNDKQDNYQFHDKISCSICFGDKTNAEYYCDKEIDEKLKPRPVKVRIEEVK